MFVGRSLKFRVLLAFGVAMILVWAVNAVTDIESFKNFMFDTTKRQLSSDANVLLTAARIRNGQLVMPRELPDEKFNQVESRVLGMIYSKKGELLWRSRSTLDEPLPYQPVYNEHENFFDLVEGEDGSYFVYDIDLVLKTGSESMPLIFVTIKPALEYQQNLRYFKHELLFWSAVRGVVMLLVLWLAMYWSLIPIKQLVARLRAIESGENDQLTGDYPLEIARLTNALNRLLRNEQRQRERYRDTMADLAHSLKTPLAVLQSTGNTLHMQRETITQQGLAELEETIDEQVQRMNQIVGYQLQRAVTRHRSLIRNQVSVAKSVERIRNTLDKVYRDKQVQADIQISDDCLFTGNEQDLMEVMGNLLENAWRLSLQKVRVSAHVDRDREAGRQDKRLELVIEDDGPGVPEDRHDVILQRGVRADSRTPGQGLGLAVVLDIIEHYDGTLTIDDSDLGGALFRITLAC